MIIRLDKSSRASEAATKAKCSAGQRRNGLPALTCITTIRRLSSTPASDRRRTNGTSSERILWHFDRRPASVWGGDAEERRQQIPLVFDRMPRRHQRARPRQPRRVGPRAPRQVVADALGGAGGTGEPRAARPAVEIDDEIEPLRAKAPCQAEVVSQSAQPARAVGDDDLGEVRVVANDRLGRAFDEIGDRGVGEVTPEGGHGRRREDDVADEAQPDEQDLHPRR